MQTNLKQQFIKTGKVVFFGLVLGLGIGIVRADWTPPFASAPTCATGNPGCDAPINTSVNVQTKSTGLLTNADSAALNLNRPETIVGGIATPVPGSVGLATDGAFNLSNLLNLGSVIIGGALVPENSSILTAKGSGTFDVSNQTGSAGTVALYLNSNANYNTAWANSVSIASPNASNLTIYDETTQQPMSLRAQDGKFNGTIGIGSSFNTSQTPSYRVKGLNIDLSGYSGSSGTDGIAINSGAGAGFSSIITQNTPAIELWSDLTNTAAKLIAGSAQFTQNPALGDVLTSDANGNGSWQTPSLSTIIVGANGDFTADAMCPAGYYAISGGTNCDRNTSSSDQTKDVEQSAPINSSYQTPSNSGQSTGTSFVGWQGKCHTNGSGNSATDVYAVCAPVPGYAFTPPPPTLIWHNLTDRVASPSTSTNGQSCDSWLAANGVSSSTTHGASFTAGGFVTVSPSSGLGAGSCMYQFTSTVDFATHSTPPPSYSLGDFGTTCEVATSSLALPNARPVASCVDNNSGSNTGTFVSAGEPPAQGTTQIQY